MLGISVCCFVVKILVARRCYCSKLAVRNIDRSRNIVVPDLMAEWHKDCCKSVKPARLAAGSLAPYMVERSNPADSKVLKVLNSIVAAALDSIAPDIVPRVAVLDNWLQLLSLIAL